MHPTRVWNEESHHTLAFIVESPECGHGEKWEWWGCYRWFRDWYSQHGSHGLQSTSEETLSKALENPIPWWLAFQGKRCDSCLQYGYSVSRGINYCTELSTQGSAQSSPWWLLSHWEKKQNAKTWPHMPPVKRLEQFLRLFGHPGFS